MIIALLLSIAAPLTAHADSITDLPALSKAMIHHYDCRLALLPSSGANKEINFQISAVSKGHESTDFTLLQGADKIVASANSEMLSIVWTRGPLTIVNAQAWIQNSTTQAQALLVSDPKDEATQAHLNCNGITFDDVKRGVK